MLIEVGSTMKQLVRRSLTALPFAALLVAISACSSDKDATGGQGGQAGASGGNGGVASGVSGLLVDDFEDGDTLPSVPGGWYGYTDAPNGGLSTLNFTGGSGTSAVVAAEGYQSKRAIEVSYSFDQGTLTYAPFVGLGVSVGSAASPADWSAYSGIAYTYRGGAHRVQLQTTEVKDYDYYGVAIAASAGWKTVTLPFKTFTQEGWGAPVSFDATHILGIDFNIRGSTGASNKLALDDLYVTKDAGTQEPDMTVHPSMPPADGSIESVAVSNPLQAKAMRYLNRGYNITNWLEQGRFNGFTYDEQFVAKLAAAGFKGIRLPVDFDLYVSSKAGSGEDLSVIVDADLFTVLDSFDAWTRAYGLSLTIDYHQYSTLPDKADADSVATMVALWGEVAKHFAGNPREDLFFELANEPEQSFGGTDPTAAEWGAIAERMIGKIRESDASHSIIFGDVEWYGIGPLSKRTPLSDSNVIYAFHDYDPFIFTHQGASWANMGATHDLPYPYDPARWSAFYSDLGFNASAEAWLLTSVQNYYREGNRAALRNKILSAKRWAVSNNVPVICNEFGAYNATSRLEDRARYYADLVSIFKELEIPWQHWFMVMDASGAVIPEYRAAMQLDD